jgi:hypothetical protein
MTKPSQWQIDQAMSCLVALRHREQISGDDDELSLLIDGAEQNVEALLRAVINAALENESTADAIKERIDLLKFRQDRYKRRADALRGTAFAMMDALGMTKFAMPEFTASIRAGSVRPVITDENEVPDEYKKTEVSIDKSAIADAVKNGVVIPGVELSNSMPSLTLKVK